MALLSTLIKTLTVLLLSVAMCGGALADGFTARRGLSMDIWTTWPDADRWGDREIMLPFPQWRQHIGNSELVRLRETGFDFIRIPIDPAPFLSPATADFREDLLRSVAETARLANDADLNAVIDLHTYPQGTGDRVGIHEIQDNPALLERYLDILRTLAKELSTLDPDRVALEIMNEPTVGCDGNIRRWEDMLIRLFAAARASATRLTLVLPGGCWSDAESLSEIDPALIPDTDVFWTFHSYAPYVLTHQGAQWTGDFMAHVKGLPYPLHSLPQKKLDTRLEKISKTITVEYGAGTASYFEELIAEIDTPSELRNTIESPVSIVAEWAAKHKIDPKRILLGEFGMIRQEWENDHIVPARDRAAYYRDMIGIAETHGFAWSLWGYGGAFGVVEEFGGRPAEPDILDMIRSLPR